MEKQLAGKQFGIFDADGTLFDAMGDYAETFARLMFSEFNILEQETKQWFFASAGTPFPQQLEKLLNKHSIRISRDRFNQLVANFMQEIERVPAFLFPDVDEVLRFLNQKGITLFLTSGTNTDVIISRLREAGLEKMFKLVLGSDKTAKGQLHLQRFAETMGLDMVHFADQAFYVGDGPSDMKYSRVAGIFAIGITNTVDKKMLKQAGANVVISSLKELVKN